MLKKSCTDKWSMNELRCRKPSIKHYRLSLIKKIDELNWSNWEVMNDSLAVQIKISKVGYSRAAKLARCDWYYYIHYGFQITAGQMLVVNSKRN